MTAPKPTEMKPGRELDALIAKHVYKLEPYRDHFWIGPDGRIWVHLPGFSTNDAVALRLVEYMVRDDRPDKALYFQCTYKWADDYGCFAYFDWKGTSDTNPLFQGHASTLAHAICIAALAAEGVIIEEEEVAHVR